MNFLTHIKKNTNLIIPIALGQLGQISLNIVDNIMVGSLGNKALGAVALTNSVFLIAMVFGIGMASSLSPLIVEVDTQNNKREGIIILTHGLVISFFLSLSMYLIICLFIPILPFLDQPKDIIYEARPFLNIISLSLIPWMLAEFLRKFSEGLSLTTPGMIVTWISVLINIILNYILIYGYCGLQKFGIIGAAYSTLIARIVLLIGMIFLLKKSPIVLEYYRELKPIIFQKKYFKKILSLGIPSGLQMFFEVSAFGVASFIIGISGAKELAAHQINMNLTSATYMLSVGFSVAATIRIGNQKALKNYIELKKAGWSVFFMSIIFMTTCGVIFILLRHFLPYIFIKKKSIETACIVSDLIVVAALLQFFDSIQSVALGALRGLQDVKIPMWLTFFVYWIVAIPLAWYFSIQRNMGAFGVWIGLGIGLALSAFLLIMRFKYKSNTLLRSLCINI